MIKKLFIVSLLSVATYHLQAVISVGTDSAAGAPTFPFSVGSAIFNAEAGSMWTVSGENLSAAGEDVQKYGMSYTPFIPVDNSLSTSILKTFPNITLTATVSQFTTGLTVTPGLTNPLLGKAYSGLTLVGTNPTVVLTTEPAFVYYIQDVTFSDNSAGLTSAQGSSTINKLEYASGEQVHLIAGIGSANLMTAHAPGIFGTIGSALSFVQLGKVSQTENEVSVVYSCLLEQASQTVALNTPVLVAGGAPLLNIGTSVAMYPAGAFMYVGVDVTSALVGSAVALFRAAGVNIDDQTPGSLTFSSILPDVVANNGANISTPVSTSTNLNTSGFRVAARNISTTSTSTGLSYLFVARDNGTGTGPQSIYAMPMVSMPSTNPDFGKIAKFNSVDTVFAISGVSYREQGFKDVIDDANEIDIDSADSEVINRMLVGAGAVPIVDGQYIKQLTAQGDAIYITIDQEFATGTTPGMFKSDAIFDASGRIMSWTVWQRVSGTDSQMRFSIKDRITDATMYVSPATPGALFNNIEQTTWNRTQDLESFISKINSVFQKNKGGVQGIIPFLNTTSGFTARPDSQVSLVAATGNGNVVIVQTGYLDLATQTFQILPQNLAIPITLDSSLGLAIGSVVTAAFGDDSVGDNWLFLGGDAGLAVLSNDTTGIGFVGTLPNTGAAQALVDNSQTCKTLGNFKFVKKIVFNGGYLYVMTQDALYRIFLNPLKFTLNNPENLDVELVVSATQLVPNSYCLDMIADLGVILLGTTNGLYSIDVRSGLPAVVTSIPIPMGLPAVSKIQAISHDTRIGFIFDYGFFSSSNLYVLSIDFVTEQARLNRFTITDGVVVPIQDQLFENQNGPLIVFDYMSNNMFIDGSLGFMTSYRIGQQAPTIKYLQYTLRAGISGRHWNLDKNTVDISIVAVKNSLGITGINRDQASGCLMLAADFGLLADS